MKILHTSDWHLGRSLYGENRSHEFAAFLTWLEQSLVREQVDVLIVAGDIFDTATPSNQAQSLYYRFLAKVTQTNTCRHIVLIGGNHDSPSFLEAPKNLLQALNVYVVGSRKADISEEVLLLRDEAGELELIVCAVPYLRDRDIRQVEAGESVADKEQKLLQGIRQHYANLAEFAEQQRQQLNPKVPIVATGHLFTAGGKTVDGDGVRDLYVGNLAHVAAHIFPAVFDYVALGHLHVPQIVAGNEHIRYSGSPIAMGFGEAKQQKSVCLVEFEQGKAQVRLLEVPCFQPMLRVQGDWPSLQQSITALAKDENLWLEVVYTGKELVADLREQLYSLVEGSAIKILRVKNQRVVDRVLHSIKQQESLENLDVNEVFQRCLEQYEVPEQQQLELKAAYHTILEQVYEQS